MCIIQVLNNCKLTCAYKNLVLVLLDKIIVLNNFIINLLDKIISVVVLTLNFIFKKVIKFISIKFDLSVKQKWEINCSYIEYVTYYLKFPRKYKDAVEYIRMVILVYLTFFTYEYFFEFLLNVYIFWIYLLSLALRLKTFLFSVKLYLEETCFDFYNYYCENSYAFIFFLFFLYFFAVLFASIFTHFLGTRGVFFICFTFITTFWIILFTFVNEFFFDSLTILTHYEFSNYISGTLVFSFTLKIDFISYCFLFLTVTIGVCAVIYSLSYFKNEPETERFIILINWFILSMCLFVLADNALLLFLGWELIGLTSFLLINFWNLRRNTLKSAMKAFTYNKFSDILLIFFIVNMTNYTGTLSITNWYTYFLLKVNYDVSFLTTVGVFLFLASSIKSAQIFGHFWLPDSMEAPIPASALIHSATLVSSGVYLLLKFNWIIQCTNLGPLVIVVGSVTAIYGAITSAAQTDCKKLLAYSTISHCGFLFITIGLNNLYLSITYLYLHGFFKALTFFCVGNLVKVSKGYQDTRKMGQLFAVLPVESILLVVCSINLGALPFTIGYFYKSLFQTIVINNKLIVIILPLILIAMLTSVIYVFRLVFYSLFDVQKNNNVNYDYYFKTSNNDEEYSNSTVLGFVFILLLFVISLYIHFLYILFYKNFLPYNLFFNVDYFEIIEIVQKNTIEYYHFFYILFGVVILMIVKINCRKEFSYLKQNYFFYHFILFILFLQITFCFLTLI